MVRKVLLTLHIECFPHQEYEGSSLTPQNILGIGTLQGQTLQPSVSEFSLQVNCPSTAEGKCWLEASKPHLPTEGG